MKKFFRWFFFFCVGLIGTSPSLSQDASPAVDPPESKVGIPSPTPRSSLPEVVITANRLKVPLDQVGSSTTVITAEDIQKMQARTILEALRGVPGLDAVRSGPAGQVSSLFLRGGNSDHTLVLMDGVPLNDPISTARLYADLSHLSTEGVERIEVVRGPQSPLYGSNALGGVIQVLTKRGGEGPKGSFLFERGEYRTFRGAASFSTGDESGHLSLSAGRLDTEGFSAADKNLGNPEADGHENNSASLRLGGTPLPGWEGDLTLRFNESRTRLDDFGGAFGDDPDHHGNARQFGVKATSSLSLLDGAWDPILSIGLSHNLRDYADDPNDLSDIYGFSRTHFEGTIGQVDLQNNLRLMEGGTVVVGFQAQREWGRNDSDYGFGVSSLIAEADTLSAYLEGRMALEERFFFTAGGRMDDFTTYGSHFTYRATAAFKILETSTKLKATFGTGFKTPSLYQLYSVYGNLGLLPEQSVGWDLGIEQSFVKDRVLAGVTYFNNDFTNLIFFQDLFVPPYGQYVNQIEARTWGVETFVSVSPLEGLWAKGVYTYTETRALDPATGDFAPFLRRPWHKAGLDLSYREGKADLGVSFRYVGLRKDYNYPSVLLMPEHFLVNLTASYRVDGNLKLYGRVDNLLDEVYEEIYGYGTPGLSVTAGAQISL